jgi:hypothetical protein
MVGDILMKLLGRVDEFKGLAVAVAPNAQLSDQAVSILRQFVESGDSELIYKSHDGGKYYFCTDEGNPMTVTEPSFISDDLRQLLALGLLNINDRSDATRYEITRSAARFIAAIDGDGNNLQRT